jgi:hypothetical protein
MVLLITIDAELVVSICRIDSRQARHRNFHSTVPLFWFILFITGIGAS